MIDQFTKLQKQSLVTAVAWSEGVDVLSELGHSGPTHADWSQMPLSSALTKLKPPVAPSPLGIYGD